MSAEIFKKGAATLLNPPLRSPIITRLTAKLHS